MRRRLSFAKPTLKEPVSQNKLVMLLCTIPDCSNTHFALGYCSKHYQRNRVHGDPHFLMETHSVRGEECRVQDCDRPVLAKDLCSKHYARQYRTGSTELPERPSQKEERNDNE